MSVDCGKLLSHAQKSHLIPCRPIKHFQLIEQRENKDIIKKMSLCLWTGGSNFFLILSGKNHQ